jgi:uncharacterized BrkB/YihY/UPF0761 family membrane protein
LSLFPLLLLLVTILGFLIHGDPHLQAKIVNSALVDFPVIGSQLRGNLHALSGSGVGLAVGILGTRGVQKLCHRRIQFINSIRRRLRFARLGTG